ncbi:MAG: protein FlbE [Hyphobacterium sp.]|nr:MAG: protein FlbE [Hyphobacterium sp.]
MTTALPKFDFQTVFSADGDVLRDGRRVKQVLTAEEVEQERQQAYAEGEASETSKAAAIQADAVRAIASQMQLILARLAGESDALRQQSATLALGAARKLAGSALDNFAADAVTGFCEGVLKDLRGEPKFNVHCAEAIAGPVAEILENISSDAGFEGAIFVRANADMVGADCRLEWASGSVERTQADIESRIESLIADWLTAPDTETDTHDSASFDDSANAVNG